MKPFLFFIFLFIIFSSAAQRLEKYFDYEWKLTDQLNARYVSIIEKKDSVWDRQDYYIREKTLQMDGSYLDSSCKIAHGIFNYYHKDGTLSLTGKFLNGKWDGLWLRYYNNGMMRDSTFYDQGHAFGVSMQWHLNGYASDSAVWNKDGSGVYVSWFDNGSPSSAGYYSAGKKCNGIWKFFHRNGELSAIELYKQGDLTDKQYFDEYGNLMDTTYHDRYVAFAGGNKAWSKYVDKALYFPDQYKIVNSDKAIVVVTAEINEEGVVTNVQVASSFHPAFDKIAVDMMEHSPKWIPAIDHNRRIKSFIMQPVSFIQEQ